MQLGINEMLILSQLMRPYRIMYKLKLTGKASAIGLNSFMVKDIGNNVDNIHIVDILKKIALISEAQSMITSGYMDKQLVLQVLVSSLIL